MAEMLTQNLVRFPPCDIVIAGFGPVGAVLANFLGRSGHRVAVFEREASVYHLPRAAHFDHEIMRVFQDLDLVEAVQPATNDIGGVDFLNGDGKKLFGITQPAEPTPFSWKTSYMFYQPDLEAALRSGVARYPNVDVFLEHEIGRVDGAGSHVDLEVRDLSSNRDRLVRADYLVACDGARSTVRQQAGLELIDLGFDESWLVIDVRLRTPVELPGVCLQICDPARPTTYVPMPLPYRRWEFMLLPGEIPADLERHDRVYELLAPWINPEQGEIVRAVVYTFHAVVADGWRRGRLLLAGDAAHQMPPFLGQGMCSGIRDAANLAWKLDLVLADAVPTSVLDTYETERRPHVRGIIDVAVSVGAIICTTDPDVAAARDAHFLDNADASPAAGLMTPRLGPGVLASEANGSSAEVGNLFIQPWVVTDDGSQVMLDDVLGRGFALVSVIGDPWPVDPEDRCYRVWSDLAGTTVMVGVTSAEAKQHDRCLAVEDRDGFLGAWFDSHDAVAVLVRPDRYVFGVAHGRDDIPRLVEQLVGHLDGDAFVGLSLG